MGSITEMYKFYDWLRKTKGVLKIDFMEAMEDYYPEFKEQLDNESKIKRFY